MAFSSMLPATSHLAVAKQCGISTNTYAREFARYSGMDIAKESVLSVERKIDEENSNIRTASELTRLSTYRPHNDPIRNHQEITAERLLERKPSRATLTPWEISAARFEDGRAKVLERARKKNAYPSEKMRKKYLITASECHWMDKNHDENVDKNHDAQDLEDWDTFFKDQREKYGPPRDAKDMEEDWDTFWKDQREKYDVDKKK